MTAWSAVSCPGFTVKHSAVLEQSTKINDGCDPIADGVA